MNMLNLTPGAAVAGEIADEATPMDRTGLCIVCTLAEGHYFTGAAALLNSLVAAGFVGEFVIGYRGALPGWLDALAPVEPGRLWRVTPSVQLRLHEMPGQWHLNNLKPAFISRIFDELHPDARFVWYLDTDIVVTGEWSTMTRWAGHGAVLVHDVSNSFMSPHHVFRRAWEALAAKRGYECREMTGYVNGGCIGLSRETAEFARVWLDLMRGLEDEGVDMSLIKFEGGRIEFAKMDQDMLNATVMATTVPLALLGYEAMGVYPRHGSILPHAMFDRKPWVRPYVLDALRGIPPGRAHLAFWKHVDGPVRPFGTWGLRRKRLFLFIARLISLFHVRISREL